MDQRIIELYDEYTHRPLPRRIFMDRLTKLAGGSAAALALMPLLEKNYAEAAVIEPEDSRLETSRVTFPGGGIEAKSLGACGGIACRKSAGRIACRAAPAVRAVGIGCEGGDTACAGKCHRQGQRILLVGAATACAADGNGQLAAGKDHHALALRLKLPREPCMTEGHLSGLAFDLVTKRNAVVTGGAGRLFGGAHGICRS